MGVGRERTRTKGTLRGDCCSIQSGLCLLWEGRVSVHGEGRFWIGVFLGYEAGYVERN